MKTIVVKIGGEIAESKDPAKAMDQRVTEYTEKFANPYIAAANGHIDAVIAPRQTRDWLRPLLLSHV